MGGRFCPTPGDGVKIHCLKIDAPVLSTFSFKIRALYQKQSFKISVTNDRERGDLVLGGFIPGGI